ncbi:deoxynucleoside triphosphate triphosphohydrolase SAMHD1-like [Physella acuta]|uniref:deoxynucleoside triphosphate triphosphohydrolase SAMHD1-like n=1 Tax=Physella acuta TaxID=109671 RepID=UPI0027DDD90A|nr:deoxynucleoside triphosphate triphosphohydrolase SAMHD1-like [Physella acuta]
MARDCRHTGIKNSFDYSRYMKLARVMEVDGELQICMRDKEALNLYNMFKTRYRLQKSAYQHKKVACLDLMVAQALKNADKHILIQGKKISECQDNVEALSKLTDYILQKIKNAKIDEAQNETPELREKIKEMKKAKEIINSIFSRKFFTCVYESDPLEPQAIKQFAEKPQVQEKIEKMIREQYEGTGVPEFFVELSYIDFGMMQENPLTRLKVYCKEDPHTARQLTKDETSTIMEPSVYDEVVVRIFSPELDTGDLKKHAEKVVIILNQAAITSQGN